MITLKQWDGAFVTPKDDAIMYDFLFGCSGLLDGANVTHLGANMILVSAGRGIIKGRQFVLTEETVNVELPDSGEKLGRLYIRMDLSNSEAPVELKHVTANTLPELIQEERCNYENGIYEIEIATFTAGITSIGNLQKTASVIQLAKEKLLGSFNIAAGAESYTIAHTDLRESSLIDIYYAEASKETIEAAGVHYTQGTGSLTLTFDSALDAEAVIANVKVVNV